MFFSTKCNIKCNRFCCSIYLPAPWVFLTYYLFCSYTVVDHFTSLLLFSCCFALFSPLHSGLCALSVNHSNSYLAHPGSATIGEIVVYDANNLVR